MSNLKQHKVYVTVNENDPVEVGSYEQGSSERETQENFVALLRAVADHHQSHIEKNEESA